MDSFKSVLLPKKTVADPASNVYLEFSISQQIFIVYTR